GRTGQPRKRLRNRPRHQGGVARRRLASHADPLRPRSRKAVQLGTHRARSARDLPRGKPGGGVRRWAGDLVARQSSASAPRRSGAGGSQDPAATAVRLPSETEGNGDERRGHAPRGRVMVSGFPVKFVAVVRYPDGEAYAPVSTENGVSRGDQCFIGRND